MNRVVDKDLACYSVEEERIGLLALSCSVDETKNFLTAMYCHFDWRAVASETALGNVRHLSMA